MGEQKVKPLFEEALGVLMRDLASAATKGVSEDTRRRHVSSVEIQTLRLIAGTLMAGYMGEDAGKDSREEPMKAIRFYKAAWEENVSWPKGP